MYIDTNSYIQTCIINMCMHKKWLSAGVYRLLVCAVVFSKGYIPQSCFVCACVYQKVREGIVETDTALRKVLQYFFFCHTFFECQTFQHNL